MTVWEGRAEVPQAMGMKDAYRKTVPSREGGGTFGLHAEPESLSFITSVLENHCRGFSRGWAHSPLQQ